MPHYKKNIFLFSILTLSFFLSSCNFLDGEQTEEQEKQWVYIELTTESKTDTTEYFYYGQIRKSLFKEIESDENTNGLFNLTNIRLWNDDDLLELYEDDEVKGDLMFRVQDIEEIVFYKDDPINLFDLEELHESTKKIRAKKK